MSDLSLNSDMNLEVKARFISKGSDAPLTGASYKLRLFDKDIFTDDYLGESGLDDNGEARISFTHNAFGNWNSLEEKPDFYFVLYKGDEKIFESKVIEDVDLEAMERFKMSEGEVIDLGTFLV